MSIPINRLWIPKAQALGTWPIRDLVAAVVLLQVLQVNLGGNTMLVLDATGQTFSSDPY
jgi:hypothetical protein